ncbi:MAG: glycosyltransferase [Nitrososphaeria archaeon]
MCRVVVVIPSFDRPKTLEYVLDRIFNFYCISKIIVVADASRIEVKRLYEKVLSKYREKVVFNLNIGYRGSVKTRNAALKLAIENLGDAEYVLLLDDDFLVPNCSVIEKQLNRLRAFPDVGAVCGRVINIKKHRVDPEFNFGIPMTLASYLTRLTGFIFGGRWDKPRYGSYSTSFMLIRAYLLKYVKFDENYAGTGYREETDFQTQISMLGCKILCDPEVFVYHLAPETGGVRSYRDMPTRMYWKSRNHAYYIIKWNSNLFIRLWYLFCGTLILSVYRPQHLLWILRGLQHGYKGAMASKKDKVTL